MTTAPPCEQNRFYKTKKMENRSRREGDKVKRKYPVKHGANHTQRGQRVLEALAYEEE